MNTAEARRQASAKDEAERNIGFSQWLARPETKLVISLIPKSDNDDALATLMRCAFDAGHHSGTGSAAMMIVEAMIKSTAPKA